VQVKPRARGSGAGDGRKLAKALAEFPGAMVFFVPTGLSRIADAGKVFMLEDNFDGCSTKAV